MYWVSSLVPDQAWLENESVTCVVVDGRYRHGETACFGKMIKAECWQRSGILNSGGWLRGVFN